MNLVYTEALLIAVWVKGWTSVGYGVVGRQ